MKTCHSQDEARGNISTSDNPFKTPLCFNPSERVSLSLSPSLFFYFLVSSSDSGAVSLFLSLPGVKREVAACNWWESTLSLDGREITSNMLLIGDRTEFITIPVSLTSPSVWNINKTEQALLIDDAKKDRWLRTVVLSCPQPCFMEKSLLSTITGNFFLTLYHIMSVTSDFWWCLTGRSSHQISLK